MQLRERNMDLMAMLILEISQSRPALPNRGSSSSNLRERKVGTRDTVSLCTANHLSPTSEQQRASLWSCRWKRLELHRIDTGNAHHEHLTLIF